MKNKCSNCVFCSFDCAINKVVCDTDNHVISDETNESCEKFVECEDE